MTEMLVIGAAAYAKDRAEDIDVMLKPQGMDSIQPCGVNMAITFFNMSFSSSRTLRFCSSFGKLGLGFTMLMQGDNVFLKLSSYFFKPSPSPCRMATPTIRYRATKKRETTTKPWRTPALQTAL